MVFVSASTYTFYINYLLYKIIVVVIILINFIIEEINYRLMSLQRDTRDKGRRAQRQKAIITIITTTTLTMIKNDVRLLYERDNIIITIIYNRVWSARCPRPTLQRRRTTVCQVVRPTLNVWIRLSEWLVLIEKKGESGRARTMTTIIQPRTGSRTHYTERVNGSDKMVAVLPDEASGMSCTVIMGCNGSYCARSGPHHFNYFTNSGN